MRRLLPLPSTWCDNEGGSSADSTQQQGMSPGGMSSCLMQPWGLGLYYEGWGSGLGTLLGCSAQSHVMPGCTGLDCEGGRDDADGRSRGLPSRTAFGTSHMGAVAMWWSSAVSSYITGQ